MAGLPGVDAALIDGLRAEKKPYLSGALAELGKVTAEQFGKLVEQVFKIKSFPLEADAVDKFALNLIQEKNCRKYELLPVGINDSEIRVVMTNPINLDAQGDIEALTGRRVVPLYAPPGTVANCLEQIFSADKVIFDLLDTVEAPEDIMLLGGEDAAATQEGTVTSPVILLVNSIISQAYRKRSSDIHIEHEEKASHVRIRVDGVLKNIMSLPKHIATGPLVSRIKIMADPKPHLL